MIDFRVIILGIIIFSSVSCSVAPNKQFDRTLNKIDLIIFERNSSWKSSVKDILLTHPLRKQVLVMSEDRELVFSAGLIIQGILLNDSLSGEDRAEFYNWSIKNQVELGLSFSKSELDEMSYFLKKKRRGQSKNIE